MVGEIAPSSCHVAERAVVEWNWDPAKDAANRSKHGISLGAGAHALAWDDRALSVDDWHTDGDRVRTLASLKDMILLIVHTHPETRRDGSLAGRIISVRKATPRERRAYAQAPR